MKYPFVLSSRKKIIIAPEGWFAPIGKLDVARREIEIGISHLGEKSLAWFLDAQGLLFTLEWRGKIPKSLTQWAGLSRQRELYSITAPRNVTAAEVLELIADHQEQFEEASNTGDLRRQLLAVPPDETIGWEFMREYLGTGAQDAASP